MTEREVRQLIAVDTLTHLANRAHTMVARSIEQALGSMQRSADVTGRELVWPAFTVVASVERDHHTPMVAFRVRAELAEPLDASLAYIANTAVPSWQVELDSLRADRDQLAATQAHQQATLTELQRRAGLVREALVAASRDGANGAMVRRMVAVLNGEATNLQEAPPAATGDAAAPWQLP